MTGDEKQFDVVMFSMSRYSEWQNGFVNRNFHVYSHLLKQPEVRRILIVEAPPISNKRALRIYFEDVLSARRGKAVGFARLSRLEEVVSGKVFRFSSVLPKISEALYVQAIRQAMQSVGLQNIVLWSYVPTYVLGFSSLPAVCRIFDTVDDWSVHESYEHMRETIEENYQKISRFADAIFTVSEQLMAKFSGPIAPIWIPNGVDLNVFEHPSKDYSINTIPSPRVCYVGVIQRRFDVEMVAAVAKQRPQYHFVIVGWVWKEVDVSALKSLPNVHFIGRVPYDAVPAILQQCQVGIVPHRNDPLVRTMNPLKVYEYLAAGLPVVASNIQGFEGFSQHIANARSTEEFINAVDHCINNPQDPARIRRDVQGVGWDARFGRMWEIIKQIVSTTQQPS